MQIFYHEMCCNVKYRAACWVQRALVLVKITTLTVAASEAEGFRVDLSQHRHLHHKMKTVACGAEFEQVTTPNENRSN